jgi:excisionase family DNA binding protein
MTATLSAPGRRPAYDWISPAQAAVRLDVAVRDVYRLIDTGVLPAYRISHEVRLLAHEVEQARREGLV